MTKYVGLDPASRGWFGVVLTDDGWDTDLFPSILSVWKYHSDAERILLGVPIGLPSDGRRACDVAARAKLGPRGRSVFYAPTRDAVYSRNIEEAKRVNESAGYSVQTGAWSVVPRIREVDEFLDVYPNARDRFHETHPEVCFYGLNGRNVLDAPKRAEEGVARRKALLAEEYREAATIYEESVEGYTTPAYAPTVGGVDDILDALVAAVTARRPPEELSHLPEKGVPEDERGLAMRIVFPADTTQTRLSTLSR
jgi:predicted RNase H-like nuclease